MENTSNLATAPATRNLKNVLSTLPEVINLYHTGKDYTGQNCVIYAIQMDQKTPKLYPSASLMASNHDLEQRVEKKLNVVNRFNCSVINIKEMITYLKDKNRKSKKR